MKIFSDERLIKLGVISGTASRGSGNGREKINAERFFDKVGINSKKVLGLRQTHDTDIVNILDDADLEVYYSKEHHEADAWLLGRKDTGIMILTADCVPLYVWDDSGKYVGLAHCGWRGIAAGLPGKITNSVKNAAGAAAKLCAYIGPHIRSCCFEVKDDVADKFGKDSVIKRDGKIFVDLSREIIFQLTAAGVKEEDIKPGCQCECTCCNPGDFFSYRREGTKDALLSFVYLLK